MNEPFTPARCAVTARYAAIGAAFGAIFPLMSIFLLAADGSTSGVIDLVADAHARFPLLYIIDTAPIFLGVFAAFAGVREARLAALNASLERQVADRTSALRAALDQAEKANAQISHAADHDSLTGLLNRRRFTREIEAAIAHSRRYAHPFALVFADLNDFKAINDTWGHEAGDRFLAGFAELMEQVARGTDKLGRWGGDEFVVLLPEIDRIGAEQFIVRLREYLSGRQLDVGAVRIAASASVGAAVFPGDGADARELLHCADQAMYRAKQRCKAVA